MPTTPDIGIASAITDFADQAVLLPFAVLIGVAMALAGWRRGAVAWLCVISGMLAVMTVLKLWAGTCGPAVYGDDLQSPSGHTAAAASIYGGALTLLLRRWVRALPIGFICAGVFGLLVGATRVIVGAHSIIEVTIGALVGMIAAMILERVAGPVPRRPSPAPAIVAGVAVIAIFHGLHMPAEAAIRRARLHWLPFGLCQMNAAGLRASRPLGSGDQILDGKASAPPSTTASPSAKNGPKGSADRPVMRAPRSRAIVT